MTKIAGDVWIASPPPGWEPVGEVCRAVFERLPAVTERIIASITTEIAEFAPPESAFTAEDLRWSIGRNTEGFLLGLAENRAPTEDELSFRRFVGERSAIRGIALQPLIASFHIGYRELWAVLVDEAAAVGGEAPVLLLGGGSRIWERMHSTIDAVAEGFQAELARREALEARATVHFIDALVRDPASEETRSLASEIGFDPAGAFLVLALVGPITSVDVARAIVDRLQSEGGVVASGQRGRIAVVIAQGVPDDALAGALDEHDATAIGVGMWGDGLAGARASLSEAERALEVGTVRQAPARFDLDWLSCVALAQRPSVEALLREGIRLAGDRPHLADAVRLFARARFSVAEGARRLGVSQNSFRYRLTRWRALTGWDPWTHDGLTRSLVAMELRNRA
ncbi:MAG TPA: helix-turn-helix domain-containing protein [Actinomycetota bacterium]